jgi:hypothetical protein
MDKFVQVKEIKSGLTKGQKVYPIAIDQDNEQWHIFNQDANSLRANTSYLFSYEINDKGFKDLLKVTPLTNVFHQRALKEIASRNDIVRNLGMMLSYAKDLVIADKIPLDQMYSQAYLMYDWVQQDADKLIPKEEE